MVGKTIKKWWPVFVLPTLAAFIIGFLWPFIWGIYLSFCKFTTVQDVTFVGLANYSKLLLDKTFSHSFWLTVIFAFVSSILIYCSGADKGIQRNQCFPYGIFYAKPDRRYCTWIHMADAFERTSFYVGTAPACTFRQKRVYRNAAPSDVAADRIYDDHLCGRT